MAESKAPNSKIITARTSMVMIRPRKLRLIADAVRSLDPQQAINYLKVLPQRGAGPMLKVYLQAMANAKNNFKLSPADLVVNKLMVEEGPRGSRKADVHAHGARFDRGVRRKRYSHIKLELVEKGATDGTKN